MKNWFPNFYYLYMKRKYAGQCVFIAVIINGRNNTKIPTIWENLFQTAQTSYPLHVPRHESSCMYLCSLQWNHCFRKTGEGCDNDSLWIWKSVCLCFSTVGPQTGSGPPEISSQSMKYVIVSGCIYKKRVNVLRCDLNYTSVWFKSFHGSGENFWCTRPGPQTSGWKPLVYVIWG